MAWHRSVTAFLHGLREKHGLSDAVFLVDQFGYRTALARLRLNGRVDYTDQNLIETWFHTLTMRIDRFHNSWVGNRLSAREWFEQFVHYYNQRRPHQSLDGKTPVEEVLNWTVFQTDTQSITEIPHRCCITRDHRNVEIPLESCQCRK